MLRVRSTRSPGRDSTTCEGAPMSEIKCRAGFTLLELVVTIAVGVIIIAFLMTTTTHTRCGSNRVKCGSNLRQIGQALLLYSNENNNFFPRTTYDPKLGSCTQYTGTA